MRGLLLVGFVLTFASFIFDPAESGPWRGAGLALRIAGLGALAGGIFTGGWIVTRMATNPERPRSSGPLLGGKARALAREDAAFRAWWAAREEAGEVPPAPDRPDAKKPPSSDPARATGGDSATEWLDRKELGEGLSAEEERFRDWLRNQE